MSQFTSCVAHTAVWSLNGQPLSTVLRHISLSRQWNLWEFRILASCKFHAAAKPSERRETLLTHLWFPYSAPDSDSFLQRRRWTPSVTVSVESICSLRSGTSCSLWMSAAGRLFKSSRLGKSPSHSISQILLTPDYSTPLVQVRCSLKERKTKHRD